MPCSIDGCPRAAQRRELCHGHYAKLRRRGDPNVGRTYGGPRESDWERSLRVLYGLTRADYDRMLAEQGGVCAICRNPERRRKRAGTDELIPLSVDHDHTTGAVRGLLCHYCNLRLGHIEDRSWLEAALAYTAAAAQRHAVTP